MKVFFLCVPLLSRGSNQFGTTFLANNKGKEGVIVLPSGLQYKVLRSGTGTDHPTKRSPCVCHYEGRTAEQYPDGQKFDSSYDRGEPATFAPNQVIAGWTEAMQLMVEGDKWEMYIPSDLAYGDDGRPPEIPGGAVLIFTMEIIKIRGKRLPAVKSAGTVKELDVGVSFLADNRGKPGVTVLPSGLQYKVLRAGSGTSHPAIQSPCVVHYEGRLAVNYPYGEKFDSSYDRGRPTTLLPSQVVKGWTEAMQLMVEGDKWEIYVPSGLAYGKEGRPPKIPGDAVLVFSLELIKIKETARNKKEAITTPVATKQSNPTSVATEQSNPTSSFRLAFDVANLVGQPSESSFTIEVHPDWAPLGAKRLQELVGANFYDDVRFFRVIDNFMAQFGINGDPEVMQGWRQRKIMDDARVSAVGNKRGRVSFAMSGKNSRTTQLFINLVDNAFLDKMGFTPVAEVVEGIDVVDRIFKIGEGAPKGLGPRQASILADGNDYLNKKFPQLSYVKSCRQIAGTPNNTPVKKDLGDGMELLVTHLGDGKTFPHVGDKLTMHYVLTLAGDTSGRVVDSSRVRDQPFTFTIGKGEVIKGWDLGILQMSLGERGMLTIPSALGYGAKGVGSIPPNADLTFDVEVLSIGNPRLRGTRNAKVPKPGAAIVPLIISVVFVAGLFLLIGICKLGFGSPAEKRVKRTLEMTMGRSAPE